MWSVLARPRIQVWVELNTACMQGLPTCMYNKTKTKIQSQRALSTLNKVWRLGANRSPPLTAIQCLPRAASDPVMSEATTRVARRMLRARSARFARPFAADRARQGKAYAGAVGQ